MKLLLKIKFILFIILCSFSQTAHTQIANTANDISPLLIGEQFPQLELTDIEGQEIALDELFMVKPSVVIFYRGGWCPYCTRHLSAIGEVEEEIIELGYQIIGIAPDRMEELMKTVDKNELNYTLLSDADGSLSQAAGVAFKSPDRYEKRLEKYSGGENPGMLPVPSVFILNENAEILFEYINPNYKHRMSAELLLAVLKSLNQD